MSQSSVLLRRAVLATLALTALPAAAQETEQPGSRSIETIVVTAQTREQSLQDVPIVVTAVSSQLLQDTGVKDIKDLTLLTPGLIVTSTSNETVTTARIRGIGTVGDNPGLESSVGVVIDGVYRPRNGVSFGDLGELERIEVLKGPQGTLFGKNTSAGVINVVSKRPSFDFGSQVELTRADGSSVSGKLIEVGDGSATVVATDGTVVAMRLDEVSRVRQVASEPAPATPAPAPAAAPPAPAPATPAQKPEQSPAPTADTVDPRRPRRVSDRRPQMNAPAIPAAEKAVMNRRRGRFN